MFVYSTQTSKGLNDMLTLNYTLALISELTAITSSTTIKSTTHLIFNNTIKPNVLIPK